MGLAWRLGSALSFDNRAAILLLSLACYEGHRQIKIINFSVSTGIDDDNVI